MIQAASRSPTLADAGVGFYAGGGPVLALSVALGLDLELNLKMLGGFWGAQTCGNPCGNVFGGCPDQLGHMPQDATYQSL